MKLAEALNQRAFLREQVREVTNLISSNAEIIQGETPEEDVSLLLARLEQNQFEMATLIIRINRTNNVTMVTAPGGDVLPISEAIVRRDYLDARVRSLRELSMDRGYRHRRVSVDDLESISLINRRELRQQADTLATERRELDAAIQAANWNTDLV